MPLIKSKVLLDITFRLTKLMFIFCYVNNLPNGNLQINTIYICIYSKSYLHVYAQP